MLVALGFLLATLIAVLLAPAYRARAMRLTYKHMRRVMPLTESELLLDRDRLRAHYAVRIHELETKLEKLRLAAARQQVEVNRRDATISALESELAKLRSELEENVNARRVLEQTVMDRLPAVEQRLAETRKLLEQRDRELATITADTSKNARALDEVMQINAQQRAEIERLNAVIATRGLRTNRGSRDPRFENELALRSELEALRAKTREQESLISRLQTLVTMPSQAGQAGRANGGGSSTEQEAELDRLRRDLVEAESALKSIAEQSDGKEVADETMRARLQSLENLVADQTAKIKRLEAALAVYEKGEGDGRAISLKDSKIAMKARIASLQAEAGERAATIEKLRAELAAANERLALQAAQFRDEVRRLRSGPQPTAPQKDEPKAAARRSLAQRITDVNPALAASLRAGSYGAARRKAAAAEPADEQAPVNDAQEQAPSPQLNGPSAGPAAAKADGKENGKAPEAAELDAAASESDAQPKPRLLDRLAGISKQ